MFCLIDRGIVTQIENEAFPVAVSENLFWIEADNANVGDKYVDGQIMPKYNLEQLKQFRLADLNQIRDVKKFAPVEYNGNVFLANEEAQKLIADALSSYERGFTNIFPINWILENGNITPVAYDDLKGINGLLAVRTAQCYSNYAVLYQQINNSNDPYSVDITVGWPN